VSTTVSATTDRISLIGLSARGHHGVLPFEREEGQLFTVDVILDLGQRGTAVAAVTDSVTDAVDYSRVANGIVSIIEGEPVNLIESLADRIAERVLSFPRVVAAEVTVHKPEAPLDVAFEDVSVTIHRVADAAAGHGGAPATSQAAWAAQAEAPVAVSAQPYASPSSSASPVAAASPAAPAYEPAAAPAAPVVSEVPDFSGASFTGALCLLLCLLGFAALRLAQIASAGILRGVLCRAFSIVRRLLGTVLGALRILLLSVLFLALGDIDIVDSLLQVLNVLTDVLQLLSVTLLLLRNVLQFLKNVTQLATDEVTGRNLTQSNTQRSDLAGQVLGLLQVLLITLTVLRRDHAVAVILTVLRQQQQGSRVRSLQRQHQGQQGEV